MGSTETKEEHQPEDDKYDVECDISSLLALGKKGWEIFASQNIRNRRKEVEQQWDRTRVVAVVGLYNKGKTTVVNMLAEQNFTASRVHRTKALSFKLAKGSNHSFIILDSAGMYSPVALEKSKLDEEKPVQKANKDSESEPKSDSNPAKKVDIVPEKEAKDNDVSFRFTQILAEKKATEMFLQELIFKLADILIVVVNDLTTPDQEYLQSINYMCSKLSKDQNKELFVVHNFRDTEKREEAENLWEQQVLKIYRSGSEETRKAANGMKIRFHNSQIGKHVFLLSTKSTDGALYNEGCIALLKNWVDSVPISKLHERQFNALQRIVQYSNEILPKYLNGPSEVVLSENAFTLKVNEPKPTLRAWKLDGFTITFSPDNTGTFSPLATVGKTINTFQIYIELPGVDPDKIDIEATKSLLVVKGTKETPYEQNHFIPDQLTDECIYGTFERTFIIPEEYDYKPESIKTDYNNGILTIELAKSKTHKIPIVKKPVK